MSKVKEPLEATAYFSKEPTVQIKEQYYLVYKFLQAPKQNTTGEVA